MPASGRNERPDASDAFASARQTRSASTVASQATVWPSVRRLTRARRVSKSGLRVGVSNFNNQRFATAVAASSTRSRRARGHGATATMAARFWNTHSALSAAKWAI